MVALVFVDALVCVVLAGDEAFGAGVALAEGDALGVGDASGTGVALVAGDELGTGVASTEGGAFDVDDVSGAGVALVAGGEYVAAVGCDACPVAESVADVDAAGSKFVDDAAGLGGAPEVVDEMSLAAPDEEVEFDVVSVEVD